MSQPSDNKPLIPLQQRLAKAQSMSESGDYRGALKTLREAKSLEPRNIYILAFEKQVEQLSELTEMHLLSNEQRSDILESLPGIIERALEGTTTATDVQPQRDTRAELDREKEERSAALEWLKNQYFQHAHEYVRKGEYQHALAEIRRVYIIDPNNRIAKDFEKQIDQLIALRQSQATPRTQTAPSAYPEGSEPRPEGLPAGGASSETAQPRLHGISDDVAELKPKRKINSTIVIAIVLTLIAVLIAGYYFVRRQKQLKPPAPTEQNLPSLGATSSSETPEQSFLLSQSEGRGTVSTQATLEGNLAANVASAAPADFSPPAVGALEALEGSQDEGLADERVSAKKEKGSGKGKSAKTASRRQADPGTSDETELSAASPPIAHTTTAPANVAGATSDVGSGSATETIIEDARILRLERPQLPEGIYASGLEGQVVVQVELDKDGNPRQTRILRSTNDLLDPAVVDAVNRSQFSPRRMSSGPVASSLTIPFTFRTKR
jgi:TonB family protein